MQDVEVKFMLVEDNKIDADKIFCMIHRVPRMTQASTICLRQAEIYLRSPILRVNA